MLCYLFIFMSRIKEANRLFGGDVLGADILEISSDARRFATPEIVALYRAERLACNTILDLCSGAGFQSFAFCKTCKHVISVEKKPELVVMAKRFAKKLGLKNITFVCGDALSADIIKYIKKQKPEIIFCDPERYASEKERKLETITPDINRLIEIYSKISQNIAIEFPPYIRSLNFDAEYEYLSLNNTLNRLNLYFGELKKATKSVVLLPEKIRIEEEIGESKFAGIDSTAVYFEIGFNTPQLAVTQFRNPANSPNCEQITPRSSAAWDNLRAASSRYTADYFYLLEPNPAIILSGLYKEGLAFSLGSSADELVASKGIIKIMQGKKIFLLAKKIVQNTFFATYKILEKVAYSFDTEGKKKLLVSLQKHNAKKVVLRYSLEPEKYWSERNFFEKNLANGDKTIHLFVFDVALVSEKLP